MTPREQLQELYRVLDKDGQHAGDRRLAYYGQLRAQEYTHKEAMVLASQHFHIEYTSQ